MLVTLAAFIGFCLWLSFLWTDGNRTADWVGIEAYIVSTDELPAEEEGDPPRFQTTMEFQIEGASYETVIEKNVTANQMGRVPIFINPDRPTESVLEKGHSLEEMQVPFIGTVASGIVGFILLIAMFWTGRNKPNPSA